MKLPSSLELQTLFSGFLFEAGLSAVSVKNYLSDIRHFLAFCNNLHQDKPNSTEEIFQSISKYIDLYVEDQKRSFTPKNTTNRRLASIRRFSTFLSSKFGIDSDISTSSLSTSPKTTTPQSEQPTIAKILDQFRSYLVKGKKSHSTIKNYISDLNHFFAWSANSTPFMDQDFENLLSESQLNAYITYLRLNHTSTSVINRRQSSIKQLAKFCFLEKYLPSNPFEVKIETPKLTPLSWIERFSSRKRSKKVAPKGRIAVLYHKYNSLPFTPYLHLAILVLATSAMVIFGYNQIIRQAKPSSAALPTVPRRQLSFQGRLTDSSGTPITTAVNVVFKLWNDSTTGTELYSSSTCSITPDPNGIFNTLIGDGTCGQEIASTVFTENRDVYLEVAVGAETLTPRQQIATVGYALNSETLQGYPASVSATVNTVPIVDENGDITLAASSPNIISTSGTFTLTGEALTLTTAANSGGDIILQPDAIGAGQVQILGATTNTDTLRIENANLTTGSLISGYIGNNTATGRLLSLTSGSTETDRFYVGANGQTVINATSTASAFIVNQNGTGDLFTASASGTNKFVIKNSGYVGIGTTNPGANLDINHIGTGTAFTIGRDSRTNGYLDVSFPSQDTTLNSMDQFVFQIGSTERVRIDNSGNVGIGLTNPSYKLDVAGDINLTAGLRANGTFGTAGQVLSTTGSIAQWIDPSSLGTNYWQRTLGSLAPVNITDSFNLGSTATSSAYVHLAGTSGDNSWINNGNFGIGSTTPTSKLYIQGASGSLLTINDTTQDIVNITSAQTTFNNPTSFTSAGDVSIAYDLNFTNPTASYIKSTAPLYLQAGEVFNSSDLTLRTFNKGNVVVDSEALYTSGAATISGRLTANSGLQVQGYATASGSLAVGYTNAPSGPGHAIFSGYVGIGLTNPSYKLDVAGDINTTGALRASGNAGTSGQVLSSTGTGLSWINAASLGTNYWQRTSGSLAPINITDPLNLGATATSSALVHLAGTAGENSWINTGNFGIGTTAPPTKLAVDNTISVLKSGTTTQVISLSRPSDYGLISVNDNVGSTKVSLNANGVSYFNSGYVGIGTTTPTTALDIAGNASTSGILTFRGTTDPKIRLLNSESLTFQTSPGGDTGLTDRLTILENGNIGIGLTNPSYILDVAGDINTTGALRASGDAGTSGQILSSTGTGLSWIDSASAGTNYWQRTDGSLAPINITDSINLGATATTSALVHLAGTAGENSFVNTGNFGIGLTNPSSKLQVAGTLTSSGGNISLNHDSNYTTNINTGTSTGAVTIGGGSNGVAVNSSTWKVSSLGAVSGVTTLSMSGQLTSTVTTGTAPFAVSSTTLNTNLNADLLDGQHGAYYAPLTNVSGTTNRLAKFTGANSVGDSSINDLYSSVAMTIDATGKIGFGTPTPGQFFQVGTGTGFQVNADGAIINANGATISGSVRFSSLSTGILRADASGYLSSSAINLASADVTGTLPILNGGTNNTTFTTGKFVAFDGTSLSSTAYDQNSFESALTFANGLTRTVNAVALGGALTGATTIDMDGNNMAFTGSGNFGIGAASPSQKLDVAGFFVVDTANSRIGIGTTTPTARVEIAGSTSTISNTSGDITINSASDLLNFSGDSLVNFLNATASGQIKLGSFADAGRPVSIGAGSLIYSTTQGNPQYYTGTSWVNFANYFSRTAAGVLYPTKNWFDSINLFAASGDGATSSAKVRLSGDTANNTFFVNPIALGFTAAINQPRTSYTFALQTSGGILPKVDATDRLGYTGYQWKELYLSNDIIKGSTAVITLSNYSLTGATWHANQGFKVGNTDALGAGLKFEVIGNASISGSLNTGGGLVVDMGVGKIDAGTIDPPYTINGKKYATYMASMIGIKEETVGKVTTTEAGLVSGLGYRTLIDLDQQPVGSDIWLFSNTTNIQSHIKDLSVLLTPEGQAKVWYEVDTTNKILAIYSSTPTNITYRLTAPRFDSDKWQNTRDSESIGHVLNDNKIYSNTNSIFDNPTVSPELIAKLDGTYSLRVNSKVNTEISSFASSIIANLRAGAAVVGDLVTSNLIVKTKLVSPIADIDQLKAIDATISGTLYANNIKGQTVDALNSQINLLNEKYATASSILADLQAKYSSYDQLLNSASEASASSDPLALSPLATTSAVFPTDLALNSLDVDVLIGNDILANGSIFTNSLSSSSTDLFIQPAGDKPVHLLANLMTLYPDGKVLVNGDLLITGTLYAKAIDTQTATVSGTLAVGSSTIASESANFNQLTTSGLIIASGNNSSSSSASVESSSNATIGNATIIAGTSEIAITNKKVTDTTLIYVTPTSDTNGKVLFIKSKASNLGFVVGLSGNINSTDISFNYWLVETK